MQALDTLEFLSVLAVHEAAITNLEILEETGHLISKSCEGEIFFWDYPEEKVVKVRVAGCRKSRRRRKPSTASATWTSSK